MKIQDGKGSGRYALVNTENRVGVDAVSASKLGFISETSANSYIITTDILTLTSTAEHSILYIKNTSTYDFSFAKLWLSYNGGSTTWNKTCAFEFYSGTSAPTANNTTSGAVNLNTGSANAAGLTVEIWDGVSTGMTHATQGGVVGANIVSKGALVFDFPGFILAPGSTVSFAVTAEEIGTVSVSATGYFDITGS